MNQPRVWALIIAGIVVAFLLAPLLAEIGIAALLRRLGIAATRGLINLGGRLIRQFIRQRGRSNSLTNSKPKPDLENLDSHAINSMNKRGWTREEILEAYEKGPSYPASDLTAGGQPATRYVNPTTGKSVVINDITGKVIHVGGRGFNY